LDYLLPELQSFFSNVKELIFIPYARPSGISHDDYTKKVSEAFTKINISVKGIHEFENPIKALEKAQGIFT
ncbi:Type 1 glutamine amidotransferase-like domain-containing protein, partial [Flavobacterium sp. LMO9]